MISPESAASKLREVFGFPAFRAGQDDVIEAVLAGRDVLAVMPTGGGKSLCYQFPAVMRGGLTVVISPLIALMRNQVAQMQGYGVAAASLNSTNPDDETQRTFNKLQSGELRLLYLSPERLALPGTIEMLKRSQVSLFAVDEAHCVSQWGHDFRPDYLIIGTAVAQLGGVQLIALTATADAATRADIQSRLFTREPRVFVHGFDRPNLRLAMRAKHDARRQLLDFIAPHKGESGIIYCSARRQTEDLATHLESKGFEAIPYHAGMEASLRSRNQDRFLQEDGLIVTATVAFGMGIDKPDVRFVAHANLPKSIEAYYQEVGRAGRDGLAADTLTLYGVDDMRLRRQQIEDSESSEDQKRVERQRLNALISLCEAPRCRRQTLLSYFGETAAPCGNCDLCIDGVEVMDATIEAQKALSAIARTGQRFGTEHLVAILRGDATARIQELDHHDLPTFGVGADRTANEWRSIFRQLYAGGVISLDIAGYGSWAITESGRAILRGKARIELRRDALHPPAKAARQKRGATSAPPVVPADQSLLDALKAERRRLATEQRVPAYVVFADRTLIEMTLIKPMTRNQMALVHGVGKAKLEQYGPAFLAIVTAHAGKSG
ncbi:MAG: DNA helicase RecQ [Hyphomicrobiales bacterium]|nr:DNA helicase RecQ [Hyphomicrobiales bacterium]